MSASWVHEDNIPQSVVTEFQSGIMPEVHIDEESSCNQLSFTANVSAQTTISPPTEKKRKKQRWISLSNSG